MKIVDINAFRSIASLGNETIKVRMIFDNGQSTCALVPAGISAGKYESKIVSVDQAIAQIKNIKDLLINCSWTQQELDNKLLDCNIGANTSLAISAAFWKLSIPQNMTSKKDLRFPKLLLLLFEGAKHGNPSLWMQEFMIVEESLEQAITDFKLMREYLEQHHIESTVGAEGGFSPSIFNDQMALDTIKTVFPDKQISLDAAGSFGGIGGINYPFLIKNYNLFSLEDPFADDQWPQWQKFFKTYGSKILIVGDDLTVTNPQRIEQAIAKNTISAVIIKPNQNGTISGTLDAVKIARNHNLKIVVSHRGEETIDDWIVDFALAVQADFVKFGGMDRGERVAKYNRLLELGMP